MTSGTYRSPGKVLANRSAKCQLKTMGGVAKPRPQGLEEITWKSSGKEICKVPVEDDGKSRKAEAKRTGGGYAAGTNIGYATEQLMTSGTYR